MKFRGIYYDIFITFMAEFFALVGFFITYKLIADYFGANSVGEYSLVKRVIGLFQPFIFLGLGVGLVRYLALTNNRTKRQSYLQASGCVVFFLTTIFVVFINIFKKEFSAAIFGAIEYASLVFPFSMLLTGLVLHMFAYTYFRGILKVKVFNILQVINLVLTPIAAIAICRSKNIEMLVFTTGALTFVVAVAFFFYPLKDLIRPVSGTIRSLKELMSYSVPRLGGDLVLAGIFSLGPIFAAHVIAIKEVGYLSIGQSLLSSACALLAPLGLVLLPKVSNIMAGGKEEVIKKKIGLLAEAIIQCSIYLCVQLIFFSDIIVVFWLGVDFIEAIPIMQIMFLSLLFYNFYIAFRGILDAAKSIPINTINLCVSSVVFISLSFLAIWQGYFSTAIGISMAFTAALICLGVLTYYSILKIYPESGSQIVDSFKVAIWLNVVIVGLTFAIKPFINGSLFFLFVYEVILGLAYFSILYLWRVKWMMEAKNILTD